MPRHNTPFKVTIAVVFASHALAAGAQSVMQPGGWEMRAKVSAQNPATGEAKTISESTMKNCLSKAFLDKEPYLTPQVDKEKMKQKGAKCSLSDEVRHGNSASWKMACTLADGARIDMSISNSASEHELKSDVQQIVNKGGKRVSVHIAMSSTFIGECTKDMPEL